MDTSGMEETESIRNHNYQQRDAHYFSDDTAKNLEHDQASTTKTVSCFVGDFNTSVHWYMAYGFSFHKYRRSGRGEGVHVVDRIVGVRNITGITTQFICVGHRDTKNRGRGIEATRQSRFRSKSSPRAKSCGKKRVPQGNKCWSMWLEMERQH